MRGSTQTISIERLFDRNSRSFSCLNRNSHKLHFSRFRPHISVPHVLFSHNSLVQYSRFRLSCFRRDLIHSVPQLPSSGPPFSPPFCFSNSRFHNRPVILPRIRVRSIVETSSCSTRSPTRRVSCALADSGCGYTDAAPNPYSILFYVQTLQLQYVLFRSPFTYT